MDSPLQAFRLLGGPCDGQIAEVPSDGFDETWRCVAGDDEPVLYARYERDGAVFRYAGETTTMERLVEALKVQGADVTIGQDSREYER